MKTIRALRFFAAFGLGSAAVVMPVAEAQVSPPVAASPRVSLLASFGTKPGDPLSPGAPGFLVEGPEGHLYGTTASGGKYGRGTIFKVGFDGTTTVLFDFDRVQGDEPQSGLTRGKDGNFYGTTYGGGDHKVGTIFCFSPSLRSIAVLYSFRNGWLPKLPRGEQHTAQEILDAAGSYPSSAPVLANDGHLYGVTTYANNQKYGVLYRLASGSGSDGFRALYFFDGKHGNHPAMLAAGADGNLYGVTAQGGASRLGTVFRATTGGAVTTLHDFDIATGSVPVSVFAASDGNVYGTTYGGGGGRNGGDGVVFKITLPGGGFSVLHKFDGASGAVAFARLTEGVDGFLYGATRYGGGRSGELFRLRKDGSDFAVVHAFVMYKTGHSPMGALLRHSDGDIYGSAYMGGTLAKGGIYRVHLTPCLQDPRPEPPMFSGGDRTYSDEFVDVRTHAFGSQFGKAPDSTNDGISIRVKSADHPHVVQFIYREKIDQDGKPLEGQVTTSFTHLNKDGDVVNSYALTTDPKRPVWNTDAPARPSPYYDSGKSWRYDCDSLTTFDQPSFLPPMFEPGKGETWRATAKSFVLIGGKVVRVVNWSREVVNDGLPSYIVQPPPPPKQSDLDYFKALSAEQGFLAWP